MAALTPLRASLPQAWLRTMRQDVSHTLSMLPRQEWLRSRNEQLAGRQQHTCLCGRRNLHSSASSRLQGMSESTEEVLPPDADRSMRPPRTLRAPKFPLWVQEMLPADEKTKLTRSAVKMPATRKFDVTGRPQEPPNFRPTSLVTTEAIITPLRQWVIQFAHKPETRASLRAYGLTDEIADTLLHSLSNKEKDMKVRGRVGGVMMSLIREGNIKIETPLHKLLNQWACLRVNEIEWSLQSKSKLRGKAPKSGERRTSELHERSDEVSHFQVDELRRSITWEGEAGRHRYIMGNFLDYVQSQLRSVAADASLEPAVRDALLTADAQISRVRSTLDMTLVAQNYPLARSLVREIHLHLGPTNSGKTYNALLALSKARTGVFAGPLRLLAHEVWDRFNSGSISSEVPPRACNLVTGEEVRVVNTFAGLTSCTVEMCALDTACEVAVIDEIQMIGDAHRGWAWTDAVLGLPAKQLHLCGEKSVEPLIRSLAEACGDRVVVHEYERLTPLETKGEHLNSDLGAIQKGDCIVTFARNKIFDLKRQIEAKTGLRCAVAYGGLPPETRSEQAKLFNDPDSGYDVMVASDAIGMGLNLKIKRVIFETICKWNGAEFTWLSSSQIKQIAGRAGRYGTGNGGSALTLHEADADYLVDAIGSPINPIKAAAIKPSADAMLQLSQLSLESRSLAALYSDVQQFSKIDSSLFFLADFANQQTICPIIERASAVFTPHSTSQEKQKGDEAAGTMLTIREREVLANVPASTRDDRVMGMIENMVRMYTLGKLVRFEEAAKHLGMIEALQKVDALYSKASEARRKAVQEAAGKEPTADSLAAAEQSTPSVAQFATKRAVVAAANAAATASAPGRKERKDASSDEDSPEASTPNIADVNALLTLESLHRCVSVYLWLSFRMPLAFCYRPDVLDIKARTERGIEFVLETMRLARASRLAALAAAKAEQEGTAAGAGAKTDDGRPRKMSKFSAPSRERFTSDATQQRRSGLASPRPARHGSAPPPGKKQSFVPRSNDKAAPAQAGFRA